MNEAGDGEEQLCDESGSKCERKQKQKFSDSSHFLALMQLSLLGAQGVMEH